MKKFLIVLLLTSILHISCTDSKEKKVVPNANSNKETSLSPAESGVAISEPWIRPAAENSNSAFYVKINNSLDVIDTLYAAESELAKLVEVHETYKTNDDKMGMRQLEFLEIIPNTITELKPKSYHIMLIGLNKDLSIGDSGKVTLKFKITGDVKVNAEVKDTF